MKKRLFAAIVFLLPVFIAGADDLANQLQFLAAFTACVGQYSAAEAGEDVTSYYEDPPDWYTPYKMGGILADLSGDKTRTDTFYGICYDYAEYAYNFIKQNERDYTVNGMKDNQYYIAAALKDDPSTIVLYDPVPRERATAYFNGTYLKEHARYRIYTHNGVSGHAWLWVQHNDGTWYWVDPTWTDNTGYTWWGKVENGREVRYASDPFWCLADKEQSPNANRSETARAAPEQSQSPAPAQRPASAPAQNTGSANYGYGDTGYGVMYIRTFDTDVSTILDFKSGGWGLSFNKEGQFFGGSLDFLFGKRYVDETAGYVKDWSFLLGVSMGYPLFEFVTPYVGGGLGVTLPNMTGETGGVSVDFAWKVNGGVRLRFGNFYTKVDMSYGTILDTTIGIGLGIFL